MDPIQTYLRTLIEALKSEHKIKADELKPILFFLNERIGEEAALTATLRRGLRPKVAVEMVLTEPIDLATYQSTTAGIHVLVAQTDPAENGAYIASGLNLPLGIYAGTAERSTIFSPGSVFAWLSSPTPDVLWVIPSNATANTDGFEGRASGFKPLNIHRALVTRDVLDAYEAIWEHQFTLAGTASLSAPLPAPILSLALPAGAPPDTTNYGAAACYHVTLRYGGADAWVADIQELTSGGLGQFQLNMIQPSGTLHSYLATISRRLPAAFLDAELDRLDVSNGSGSAGAGGASLGLGTM